MPLTPGTRLGPYEIQAPLGAGGMGEVYRARDTRLHRDVALKVLPAEFTANPERLARFAREARALAALNHPHIGSIYGLEDSDGIPALVLELVEGPTLAERLERGPVPLAEVVALARQIADAIEAAHEKGIVHRDLKPANVKITPAGTVKVLDFGLARAAADTPQSADLPTVTALATGGAVLGTPAYMSPEQARGQAVDRRTDIWAFGCVLYEMLTGRAAFARSTIADTFAAIVEREPEFTLLPASTPPALTRLLRRCLEKDPKRRLRDVGDVSVELGDVLTTAAPPVSQGHGVFVPGRPRRTGVIAVLLGFAAVVAAAVGFAIYRAAEPGEPGIATRLSLSAPGVLTPQTSVAVSPDGQRFAFVATDAKGRSVLWLRALDSMQPRALPGTEDAAHPFWSPDGNSLGFLAGGKVKRIDLSGSGAVLTLAETTIRNGASWSGRGRILFLPQRDVIASVPASGGPVTMIMKLSGNAWPHFLPDDTHFLFADNRPPTGRGIYVGSLGSPDVKFLVASDFKGAYAEPGYLLTVRDETLMAYPFDATRLEVTGEPVAVAEGVWGARNAGQASFSVSRNGVLAYVNATLFNRQFAWFDRGGRSLGNLGAPDRNALHPEISPDGTAIAFRRGPLQSPDVWVINPDDGAASRITFGTPPFAPPLWSNDGRLLYGITDGNVLAETFGAPAPGITRLLTKDARGGAEEEVGSIKGNAYMWDVSRDGRFIVYSAINAQGTADLWVFPRDRSQPPYLFAESRFHKTQAQISPNGRWIAYTSYESGTDEVYVQSFPVPGNRHQVSAGGGMQPRWREDGRELFYLGADQYLRAAQVITDDAFKVGSTTQLFRTRLLPQGSQSLWFETGYDVTANGQRFLVSVQPDDPEPPMTVVLNWQASLRR